MSKDDKEMLEIVTAELKAAYLRCSGAKRKSGSIDESLMGQAGEALIEMENHFRDKPGKPTLQPDVPVATREMFDALWGLVYGH